MKKTGLNWLFLLSLLIIAAIMGIAFSGPASFEIDENVVAGDAAWMLTATALVLIMTPGLAFFYGGMIQSRNILSTMLQSFIAMGVISVLWIVVGFSIAFGDSIGPEGFGLFGNPATFFMFRGVGGSCNPDLSPTIPLALFAMFQLKFAIITPALITGSFAGRVRFRAYMLFMVLFCLFIYAPLAHWTWHPNGFLRNWGVLDFAGGTVVHMSAGFAALAGAMFLGRRKDFHTDREIKPANIPFVLLGAGMLWFGWFGFNAGSALGANSTAALALMNTNTASAAAMLTWIFFDAAKGKKPSSIGAAIGLVVGLVAITPAAGFVSIGSSIFIGVIAALVSNYAIALRTKSLLDDTLDVFPAHGMGGITGMILTAVFANKVGLIYGEVTTFLYHLLALVIVGVFSFGGSWMIYKLTNMLVPLRVSAHAEKVGLDISQHDESYDFEYKTVG
ncbi:MAG: ammonia channel protein [Bacteroidetes bacterium GWF2_42_66]|nr:MAG: ammonia channel protein [Bacteroidetes bacterium GWA2_42_15]OFY00772.1 MAG: ammonia channel protein [Bacteroidetes bacterium GWE2_42_39]OFY40798.1 MAG: ammonia channel protein [Bacteroidetes bacterium GWF2_42_66]HBL75814.1 ammonia channel protein [Prolixibacteraceae bacterium]HCR91576.1 ammonia channel protein [Prolixibacteraceae bacterium]